MSIERTYLNIIKAIYDKLTADIILSSENLKAFPLSPRKRKGCPIFPFSVNILLKSWSEILDKKTFKFERDK